MAEAEHTLFAGVIFIDPVLAAHSRVEMTTDLTQPVESGAEIEADFGRLVQAFLHDVLDLCQPLVDRYVHTVEASANRITRQPLSACHLLLLPGPFVVSVVWRSFSHRVGVLAVVIFRRRAVESTLRLRGVFTSESLSSLGWSIVSDDATW
jgi:hypothetical protein